MKKKKQTQPTPDIVGPDYVQVLRGEILNKKVSIILCGESHEDAIDVTRSGGFFKPKEGWIATSNRTLAEDAATFANASLGPSVGTYQLIYRIWKRKTKLSSLDKAKQWSADMVREGDIDIDHGEDLLLIWIPNRGSKKGSAFILVLTMKDFDEDGMIIDDSSSDDTDSHEPKESRKKSSNHRTKTTEETEILAHIVSKLNALILEKLYGERSHLSHQSDDDGAQTHDFKSDIESQLLIFEWGDLDEIARDLNRQRIIMSHSDSCAEMSTSYHDEIIQQRKAQLREKENIWTFDDWFSENKKKLQEYNLSESKKSVSLNLVLEGGVPPSEVELCREGVGGNVECDIPEAADCVRCLSEDSDGSTIDDFDPSSDGIGSFLDFLYRRFADEITLKSKENESNQSQSSFERNLDSNEKSSNPNEYSWLHCVDSRDLGCETGRVCDSLKAGWTELLLPHEQSTILKNNTRDSLRSIYNRLDNIPQWATNPEDRELLRLEENGSLSDKEIDTEYSSDTSSKSSLDEKYRTDLHSITFPSFEGFFGQNTDVMYYTPNVKVIYAPFLAKCVGSLSTWDEFFTSLFFGGTVSGAISLLKLDKTYKKFIHVRSPVQKDLDSISGQYKLRRRHDNEGNVTFPFFPFNCFLKAKGSNPSRTWSSQLFHKLTRDSGEDKSCVDLAYSARKWILESIHACSNDPKNADDKEGGGEWFLAFLRANYREIYDDIDRTDPTILLHKKYIESESDERRKYNIGEIHIPTCKRGFDDIIKELAYLETLHGTQQRNLISSHVEAMSKILIDIWMSNLVDFNAILKIIDIVATEVSENIVIVCYMGSVHTKAIANFFCDKVNFTRILFVGEYNWDEDSARRLSLPPKLWNMVNFF